MKKEILIHKYIQFNLVKSVTNQRQADIAKYLAIVQPTPFIITRTCKANKRNISSVSR
jgi:uncharacterized membrane protein